MEVRILRDAYVYLSFSTFYYKLMDQLNLTITLYFGFFITSIFVAFLIEVTKSKLLLLLLFLLLTLIADSYSTRE